MEDQLFGLYNLILWKDYSKKKKLFGANISHSTPLKTCYHLFQKESKRADSDFLTYSDYLINDETYSKTLNGCFN